MKLGYIGLGKMGHNMVERLIEKGHDLVAFDTSKEAIEKVAYVCREAPEQECENPPCRVCASGVENLEGLVEKLETPRVIWMMVPYKVVDTVLAKISPFLQRGDMVIDGGNSPYKDSIRRAAEFKERGIHFLDVGVSGGPRGAREGACLMVGGEKDDYKKLEALFQDLAVEGGYGYMGKSGAGHFVKMVHNGIEYGMMQSLAEGFAIMKKSEFDLKLKEIARVYNHGSVIEARLTGWLGDSFAMFGEELEGVSGSAQQSGEGLWTVDAADEFKVEVPVIKGAVQFRKESEKEPSFTGKIISALRNQFGGHNVK